MRTFLALSGIAVLLATAGSAPAYAYLDPGTGSMILQLLLGGLAGALVIIKLYWVRFKEFFVRKPAAEDHKEDSEGQ